MTVTIDYKAMAQQVQGQRAQWLTMLRTNVERARKSGLQGQMTVKSSSDYVREQQEMIARLLADR